MKLPARFLLALAAATAALTAQETIKIGEYASLTGKEASFGQQSHKGLTLAIEEINAPAAPLAANSNCSPRTTRPNPASRPPPPKTHLPQQGRGPHR